jgi:mercuric reductase
MNREINNSKSESEHFDFQTGTTNQYDLIVIGGGSAAAAAAIRASELGKSTLIINSGLPLGGTCVNIGCVPSKFMILAAEKVSKTFHSEYVNCQSSHVQLDFGKIMSTKIDLVTEMQKKKYEDVLHELKRVSVVEGLAEFKDAKTVMVNGKGEFTAEKFLIATGASPNMPNIEGLVQASFLTIDALLDLKEKPVSLTILGAGYIGLEMAMAYSLLGVRVRILESGESAIGTEMPDISTEIEQHLRIQGIEFFPKHNIVSVETKGSSKVIRGTDMNGHDFSLVEKGHIVIATGMRPNSYQLGADKIKLKLSPSGHIMVDDKMKSNLEHIYAAGDVTDTPAFVYTAAYEARIAVENALSAANEKVDYSALPWVIFTDPQVAGVGLDEKEATEKNIPHDVRVLHMSEVPRSIVSGDKRGFIKFIRQPETDRLLGARIIAHQGGELVMEAAMAIRYGITVTELSKMLHPYLTLSEAIKLTALSFYVDVSKLSCCAS